MTNISRVLSTSNLEKQFQLSINLDNINIVDNLNKIDNNDIEKNLHSINNYINLNKETTNITLKASFLKTCDLMLLENHVKISKIIEENINIAEPNKILGATLLKYLRHVSVYKLLRDSNEYNIWPHDFGEPYPDNLKYLIEKKTFELQKEYNSLTNDYKID